MANEENPANEVPTDQEMQFLDPEGPPQPVQSSLFWNQVVAFGLAPIAAGGAIFLIYGNFFVQGCRGATRSASLEWERRQELIEQAKLEYDNPEANLPHNE